ncbi:hypothetical protein QVM86_12720 [Providencia stuartii]|uniref:hypothetical protein n=1 Tax=Providencia stuartii TaxID=588 RepID=UPI0025AB39FD|nr:hypothetical protein [Providencia stuartii]MDN0019992.1 hypothetical protein [Providencia stuartii]
MNKLNSGLLALMLMSVGFAAAANGPDNRSSRPHMGNHHNVLFSVAQQTTTPNETLKKLANDAPKAADGKRYLVKMSIVEVPEYVPTKQKPTSQPTKSAPAPEPAAQ